MNLQKILHSYKNWQDYNKQYDIGLMTFYQNQEMPKWNELPNEQIHQRLHEAKIHEVHDDNLHYEVEAELLGKEADGRYYPHLRTCTRKSQTGKLQISLLGKSGAKGERKIFRKRSSIENQERRGIKLGYYDVTQLSNLQSHRTIDECPLLERFASQRRRSSTLNSERASVSIRQKHHLKLPPEQWVHRTERTSPKKPKLKTTTCLSGIKGKSSSIYGKAHKNHIKTQQQPHPINLTDYRLMNIKSKLNDKNKTYRNSIRREIKQASERYTSTLISSTPKNEGIPMKQGKDLGLVRFKRHTRTLMGTRLAKEGRLRQDISIYFTPVNLSAARRYSQSL